MIALILAALVVASPSAPVPTELPPALATARTVAEAITEPALRAELQQEVALALVRHRRFTEAAAISQALPPFRQASVQVAMAMTLPASQRAEAEQLLLDAQTARALTNDWHKTRLSRLLAATHARFGHFEAAEAMARDIPDIEDRAFALREIVGELSRAGEIAKARELAGAIEENRRYGTYRQKAGALAETARLLHTRGDPDGATTLLAQAELLLPKKPGWSDGGAIIEVALAEHACGQPEKARELITRAETLAQAIAGPWKVSELVNVSACWRAAGETKRANTTLAEAAAFLPTLPALERAPESIALARGWFAADEKEKARSLLVETIKTGEPEKNADAGRKPHVLALLAWAELFGDAATSHL